MPFTIPDDLDLMTNIKAGINYRIRNLDEQKKNLIFKNQRAKENEKQFFLYLIKETADEILKLKDFEKELLHHIEKTFDVSPDFNLIEEQ
ncbi:MAG: hypothetical protein DRO88_09650 [Promethearchaeia archaeon]|nr:MAG: hypothetical protein DRO88_09650 [Candidatus Lokiarchaeia archaeon]